MTLSLRLLVRYWCRVDGDDITNTSSALVRSTQPLILSRTLSYTLTIIICSPNNKFIVSGGGIGDKRVKIWKCDDLLYKRQQADRSPRSGSDAQGPEREGHHGSVTNVAVTADGKYIVSSSRDGTVQVWSFPAEEGHTNQGQEKVLSIALKGAVDCMALSSVVTDGEYHLATASIEPIASVSGENAGTEENETKIRIYSIRHNAGNAELTERCEKEMCSHTNPGMHHGAITCLVYNRQGTLLASAGTDGFVCLWNTGSNEAEGPPAALYSFAPETLVYVNSLSFLGVLEGEGDGGDNGGDTESLQLVCGGELTADAITTIQQSNSKSADPGMALPSSVQIYTIDPPCVNDDGTMDKGRHTVEYMKSSDEMAREIVEAENSIPVGIPPSKVNGIAISADGKYIASGACYKHSSQLYTTKQREFIADISNEHNETVSAITLNEDTMGNDNDDKPQVLVQTSNDPFHINCAAFLPNSSHVVVGSGNNMLTSSLQVSSRFHL